MSAPLTYPGVYVEEISSGVRTIMSVSTAVTAFIGYTKRGLINKAQQITSFADFERKYGGLSKDSLVSYAVQQFFMNGGQSAIVVRIAQGASQAEVTLNSLSVPNNPSTSVMRVIAKEPGAWANGMTITVDYDTPLPDSTFNLKVLDLSTGQRESFLSLSMNPDSRHNASRVINDTSKLISVDTDVSVFELIKDVKGKSIGSTGEIPILSALDKDHLQFMITLNENDGPKLVTIYDGINKPQKPDDLKNRIKDAVRHLGTTADYRDFDVNATDNELTLISGEKGSGSFVRVSRANTLDAASVLKLGVSNGGKEIDAASYLRPTPNGTTSKSLNLDDLQFDRDRKILMTIGSDGPHELVIFKQGTDTKPEGIEEISQVLQKRIQLVTPNKAGSMDFMGVKCNVVGDSIQILSGAADPNSVVKIENDRVLENLNSITYSTNGWWVAGDNATVLCSKDGIIWNLDKMPEISPPFNSHGICSPSDGIILAVGDKAIIYRRNENNVVKWEKAVISDLPKNSSPDLWGISSHSTEVWAVGDNVILHSVDSGVTWKNIAPDTFNANLKAVCAVGEKSAWAIGDDAKILRLNLDDQGTLFVVEANKDGANLRDIYYNEAETEIWIVGDDTTIWHFDPTSFVPGDPNSLKIEKENPIQLGLKLSGISFGSDGKGCAVGDDGILLRIIPKDSEYEVKPINGWTSDFKGILFEGKSGVAVGNKGFIILLDSTKPEPKLTPQQATTDTIASDLELIQNVKSYALGTGKNYCAQSSAKMGSDGQPTTNSSDYLGSEADKTGINALLDVDIFNILCLPGASDLDHKTALAILSKAASFCEEHRAFLIIDCPDSWLTSDDALSHLTEFDSIRNKNAAMYFPRLQMPDILDENRLRTFPQCGVVAGIYARTDGNRGVWKAPAGQETLMTGVRSLDYRLTDKENGLLNPLGLNCLRIFPIVGPVVWGARTLLGADVLTSEWKYIPVRRTALFIEESLFRGLKWVVFEPNAEPLWSQIRLNVGAFMQDLFRKGAFQGQTAQEAYFVKCDKETTTQSDIDAGIVNVLVGFAPLKPAEFVVIKLQQMAGQTMT